MKKPRPVSWKDCGNAVYEDQQLPMAQLRKRYNCDRYHVKCAECPVFREKGRK